ncbi:hypothetical protein N7532_008267 [Penicillium argentinense]|uniref:Inosine triphosphate pyrophosphatase n=1 Tax=Penicillium argentinense TaxID=1131581 RepID=A0A9W9EX17_9EURO|nr:uncharacterized protein N7532_008267 [Penicillium argentinense]KAJ5089583.1 hypothetical protein N7532_008267 [Penicillium argentinense]
MTLVVARHLLTMKTCTFVTGNPNKVIEVSAILGESIPIEPLALDIPEIQGTLEEIARDKCRRAARVVDGPVIVEDSALEFNSMNKLPGPYIKYFLESLGNDGLYKLLYSYTDKSAQAVCTFAFTTGPAMDPIIFQGKLEVCKKNKPEVSKCSYIQIGSFRAILYLQGGHPCLNKLSHRYKALVKFQEWLRSQDTSKLENSS